MAGRGRRRCGELKLDRADVAGTVDRVRAWHAALVGDDAGRGRGLACRRRDHVDQGTCAGGEKGRGGPAVVAERREFDVGDVLTIGGADEPAAGVVGEAVTSRRGAGEAATVGPAAGRPHDDGAEGVQCGDDRRSTEWRHSGEFAPERGRVGDNVGVDEGQAVLGDDATSRRPGDRLNVVRDGRVRDGRRTPGEEAASLRDATGGGRLGPADRGAGDGEGSGRPDGATLCDPTGRRVPRRSCR